MTLNLKDFQTEMRRSGVHHNNRYRTLIDAPQYLAASGSNKIDNILKRFSQTANTRKLSLRCTAATFPGRQMMTKDDIFRYGYGPVEKAPSGVIFQDITCSFVLDDQGDVYQFFNDWQSLAVRPDASGGMNKFGEDELDRILEDAAAKKKAAEEAGDILVLANAQPSKSWQPYEIGYKDKYVGKLQVDMLNVRNRTIMRCKADRVFPVAIGEILMGYDQNDQVSLLPVTFAYRDYTINKVEGIDLSSVLSIF